MKRKLASLYTLPLVFASASFSVESDKFKGSAFDKVTGKFIYTESHVRKLNEGKPVSARVQYLDQQGNAFVEKKITYKYSAVAPNFTLIDRRTGYEEGAKVLSGNRLQLFNKVSQGKKRSVAVVPFDPNKLVVDAGFDEFIRENWTKLQSQQKIAIQFAVPAMLRTVEFRVYKVTSKTINGKKATVFSMDLGNFFLRLFIDPIIVSYDNEDKKLLRYEGVSNILNNNGDNYVAKIIF